MSEPGLSNDFEYVKGISYKIPDIWCRYNDISEKTIKSIKNAFDDAIVDTRGIIWIDSSKLHILLRVKNKAGGKFYLETINSKEKRNIDSKIYIRSTAFTSLVQLRVEENSSNKYLPLVRQWFLNIDMSERVKNIRFEFEQYINQTKKGLKKKRIRQYKIDKDELTNEKLNKRTAEFSHIRCASYFVEYSDKIENGLIVNKETHQYITAKEIYDEDQLFRLCNEQNWNTEWYYKYKEVFN